MLSGPVSRGGGACVVPITGGVSRSNQSQSVLCSLWAAEERYLTRWGGSYKHQTLNFTLPKMFLCKVWLVCVGSSRKELKQARLYHHGDLESREHSKYCYACNKWVPSLFKLHHNHDILPSPPSGTPVMAAWCHVTSVHLSSIWIVSTLPSPSPPPQHGCAQSTPILK